MDFDDVIISILKFIEMQYITVPLLHKTKSVTKDKKMTKLHIGGIEVTGHSYAKHAMRYAMSVTVYECMIRKVRERGDW